MSRRRTGAFAAALASVLVAAGCGSSGGGSASPGGARPTHLAVREASVDSPLPEVVVRDVGARSWVQLKNLLPADRPVLVWFWAPYCPTCKGEASDVERFATEHAATLSVVGLGAQNDLAEAEDFVASYGPFSFPMYWDETFDSWNQLGVTSQPRAALFAADGTFLDAWIGRFPESKVEALVAEHPAP